MDLNRASGIRIGAMATRGRHVHVPNAFWILLAAALIIIALGFFSPLNRTIERAEAQLLTNFMHEVSSAWRPHGASGGGGGEGQWVIDRGRSCPGVSAWYKLP